MSCQGVGQSSMHAGMQKTPANAQPARRGPTLAAGWATATGRTNINSAAVDAVTAWGETIPMKSTPNPTIAIATTASTFCCETTVPRVMKTIPTRKSAR